MGAVYEAFDQRLQRLVALKHLMQSLLATPEARQAFEREARLLAALRHPALPVVIDHFSEGDNLFLVMDFIPGDDLGALLQRRHTPFPASEVLDWAGQVLSALAYLHGQPSPIIHRDIKPANLKLTPDQRIYLLDFGISKGALDSQGAVLSSFGATPAYAPLEQILGRGTDAASDLYALAATLYQLLTCSLPEAALLREATIISGGADPLIPPHERNPAIPPAVSELIVTALSLRPYHRYASAGDMRRAVQTARDALASGAPFALQLGAARPSSAQVPVSNASPASPAAPASPTEPTALAVQNASVALATTVTGPAVPPLTSALSLLAVPVLSGLLRRRRPLFWPLVALFLAALIGAAGLMSFSGSWPRAAPTALSNSPAPSAIRTSAPALLAGTPTVMAPAHTASATAPAPSATRAPAPTRTPQPTETAAPTSTPQPTETPASTSTPQPTETPAPPPPTAVRRPPAPPPRPTSDTSPNP
jgi:serine/threonine protein kinase